ncbi:MAG: hypothetical protein ACRCUT_12030, partial [Spirochaetota bacterium]
LYYIARVKDAHHTIGRIRRMHRKIRISLIAVSLITVMAGSALVYAITIKESSFLLKEKILPGAMKMLPVPSDFRNYFILQSINDETSIIIGDFSGADKVISMTTDANQDGTPDKTTEFFPDAKKMTSPSKSSSQFFSDFSSCREDIINGKIFNQNYSYKMMSLNMLEARIREGKDLYKWGLGWNAKVFDPDNPSTIMGEFFFSRKEGRYTLIFATYYYKLYKTKITPPLYYSVYCNESKDPKIAAVVDNLYKMLPNK